MWCWSAKCPTWRLRHKWLNTKMTYGMNSVQEEALHLLGLTKLWGRYLAVYQDTNSTWNVDSKKSLPFSFSSKDIRSAHIKPSSFTCCEDTDDSHNVSGCPTGHLALDCPNHKTNCIIRPALLGTDTFWPFADTCHGKWQYKANKLSKLIHLSDTKPWEKAIFY